MQGQHVVFAGVIIADIVIHIDPTGCGITTGTPDGATAHQPFNQIIELFKRTVIEPQTAALSVERNIDMQAERIAERAFQRGAKRVVSIVGKELEAWGRNVRKVEKDDG